MINEKNTFLTVSWLSGLLSAEIFISTGEWGVQMPPLTTENSHFLRSGPTLGMIEPFDVTLWYSGVPRMPNLLKISSDIESEFRIVQWGAKPWSR